MSTLSKIKTAVSKQNDGFMEDGIYQTYILILLSNPLLLKVDLDGGETIDAYNIDLASIPSDLDEHQILKWIEDNVNQSDIEMSI